MFRPELRLQLNEEQGQIAGNAYLLLQRAIERCQAECVAPPGDPSRLILLAWSAVHGASALWIDGSLHDEQLIKDEAALAATVSATVVELLATAGDVARVRR
jgi:hypothetical protein